LLAELLRGSHLSIVLNEHFTEDGEIVFREACKLGCEGIVSKRLGSPYRSGRSPHWVKVKNPKAPAVTREAEEDWGRRKAFGCAAKNSNHTQAGSRRVSRKQ
jgi:bifunctional non-homologous end joining protein LigD